MVKKERSNAEKALKGDKNRIYDEEGSKESESDVGFSNTQSSISSNSSSISNKNDNKGKNNNGPHILTTAEREALRSEKIIKKHLFGVPPPEDKKIFDDMQGNSSFTI